MAFLITATGGLILALQITYKLNIPFIKSVLKWHVEFGIGLAATGIIHFLWHLSYFRGIFKSHESLISFPDKFAARNREEIRINLFIVGFVSTGVQLLLLREMINIAGGYELVSGTFLGSWLIGSAAGAFMASKSNLDDPGKINLMFFTGPAITIFLMLLLSRLFLKSGETPSFLASVIFTLIVLLPFCFISGFTFIKLLIEAGSDNGPGAGISFSVETTGGIIAGIVISSLSTIRLNTYQALVLIIILGISYLVLSFYSLKRPITIIFKIIILAVSFSVIVSSPDRLFRQFLLRGIKIIQSKDTPYGNITEGEYNGEKSTFYDHRLIFYHEDVIEREEDIHYAMLQTSNVERVLLISGSLGAHFRELLKYPVKEVQFVERDPSLIRAEGVSDTTGKTNLVIENTDAYNYIKRTDEKFDAVILLLPPPSSLLLNRYYTLEFFRQVKKVLKPGAVFSCSPGINPDYLNDEAATFFSSVYNSLSTVFNNVIPISGNKLYLIASDKRISTSICDLVEKKQIRNTYVGPDYLSDDLITVKSKEILSVIDKNIRPNRILTPVAAFYYQIYSLSKSQNQRIPTIFFLVLFFIFPILYVNRKNLLMYFSSSALAGYEIILLLVLQSAVGNMYQLTGMIIAGLMAGLAVGSGMNIRFFENHSFRLKALLLIIYYCLMYLFAGSIISSGDKFMVTASLIISGFIPAMITGNIFREFTAVNSLSKESSAVYGADLLGSALGCLAFSGLIVPFLGIKPSLIVFPLLVLAGYLFAIMARK